MAARRLGGDGGRDVLAAVLGGLVRGVLLRGGLVLGAGLVLADVEEVLNGLGGVRAESLVSGFPDGGATDAGNLHRAEDIVPEADQRKPLEEVHPVLRRTLESLVRRFFDARASVLGAVDPGDRDGVVHVASDVLPGLQELAQFLVRAVERLVGVPDEDGAGVLVGEHPQDRHPVVLGGPALLLLRRLVRLRLRLRAVVRRRVGGGRCLGGGRRGGEQYGRGDSHSREEGRKAGLLLHTLTTFRSMNGK